MGQVETACPWRSDDVFLLLVAAHISTFRLFQIKGAYILALDGEP